MTVQDKDSMDHRLLYEINERLKKIAVNIERVQIADYVRLMNRPWRLILINLLTGISRGVGIAIGVTLVTSTLLYFLQLLGALDLPIIGKYIAVIIRYVQLNLEKG